VKRPIFDSLVETASDHHGYVTTLQAREAGVDPTQLRLLAGRGRLEHVARGVYRVPVLPRSEHDDLAFAVAWARGRAVLSHESALVLHGLSDVNPSVVHLTAPPDNYPRAQGSGPVRIHRRELPGNEVTVVDGLPVTTVARTIMDCQVLGTDPAQLRLAIRQARQSGELSVSQAQKLETALDHRQPPDVERGREAVNGESGPSARNFTGRRPTIVVPHRFSP
jgi:predicted transcriptional regulator of viral defense system